MQFGIHLPHAGEQAMPALIRRHAERAEDLGFDDVWVSEHIIVPRKFPRSPLFYDPVLTLTWAAAVTKRVRLGTTVLVLPMRHPLPLAKELATLHNLSERPADPRRRRRLAGGRVRRARRALPRARPAHGRGHRDDARRLDAGSGDVQGQVHPCRDHRDDHDAAAGQPIPIWIGGSSDAALKRTMRIADGWHGSRETPEEAAPIVKRLRAERPDAGFTVSMRVQWNGRDQGELRERIAAYETVGVEHIMVAPENREVDDWDAVIEGVGRSVAR